MIFSHLNFVSLINSVPDWEKWTSFGLCLVGASLLLIAIFPGCFEIYKTQNTLKVPMKHYILLTIMCCCFALGAEFWLIESVQDIGGSGNEYGLLTAQAAILLLVNIINGSGNLYVVLLKRENEREAKRIGISNEEYYETYCLPRVEARSK